MGIAAPIPHLPIPEAIGTHGNDWERIGTDAPRWRHRPPAQDNNTMNTTQPPIPRLSLALRAAADSWDSQQEPAAAVLDELAAAIIEAPAELWAAIASTSPELHELHAWAQAHHERQQHAEFFALLAHIREMPPEDVPAQDFQRLAQLAPERFLDAAMPIVAEYLPRATHCDSDGNPLLSIEQLAQHFDRTPEQVAADIERLGLEGRRHTGPVHPLQ